VGKALVKLAIDLGRRGPAGWLQSSGQPSHGLGIEPIIFRFEADSASKVVGLFRINDADGEASTLQVDG
jgi:hypothetical protein